MPLIKLFSREYSVQYTEIHLNDTDLARLDPEIKSLTPCNHKTLCYLPENKNQTCCVDKHEWQKFTQLLSTFYKNKDNLKKLIEMFHKWGQNYIDVTAQILNKDLSASSNEELSIFYNQYLHAKINYCSLLWITYLVNNDYAKQGEKILANKNLELQPEIINTLFSPKKLCGIFALQKELADKELSEEEVNEYVREYSWISCLDIKNNTWTKEEFLEFYQSIPKQNELVALDDAYRAAQLDEHEKTLFEDIKELAYIKDMRDVYRRRSIRNSLPFFDEIAKRISVTREELAYLLSSEIKEALRSEVPADKNQAQKRMQGHAIYWDNNTICATSNEQTITQLKETIEQNKSETIKGICASKGVAQGNAKVVLGIKDLTKVQTGDILVAVTTHPDYITAMQKAAAFVTQEGGLTSHAAIVAREMNKPCIVAAKNCIANIKDNDRIEVDANTGEVKKI